MADRRRKVTDAQFAMLLSAERSNDHTVWARGFNTARHAYVTGKALVRLGLLEEIPAHHVPHLYKITAAGRECVNHWGDLPVAREAQAQEAAR